jgi:hypothetical protein
VTNLDRPQWFHRHVHPFHDDEPDTHVDDDAPLHETGSNPARGAFEPTTGGDARGTSNRTSSDGETFEGLADTTSGTSCNDDAVLVYLGSSQKLSR